MKKSIFFFILLATFFFLFFPSPTQAIKIAGSSAMVKDEVLGIKKPDPRTKQLEKFLNSYHSPLAPYASWFIQAADEYQVDWRLLPAIAGVESSFGKRIPPGSFNAYGWNNGNYRFNSWEDSIRYVTKALGEKYIARGLDTPFKIGSVYAPPSPAWATKVLFFMKKIDPNQNVYLNSLSLTI